MAISYFDGPVPRVLAHRGLATRAPENTLAAFAAARRVGAHYLETDVRLTRDGAAVLVHDETFGSPEHRRPIRTARLAELRGVDLGDGHGIATLAEALDAFPDARFNIDVKVDEAVDAAVDAVRRVNAQDRVLFASFSEARRRRLANALPGVATSPGTAGVARVLLASRSGSVRALRLALRGAAALQVPERARSLRVVSPRLIRAVHAVGAEIHVWTINEAEEMRRLLALGVDGIVTDRCDVAMAIVRPEI